MNRSEYTTALHQLKKNSGWYLTLGVSLVVLGALATLFAYTTTMFSILYLGAFFIVLGIFEGIKSFKIRLWSTFFLHIFLCILYCLAGVFTLMHPTLSAINLTLLLAIFFIISGVARIVFALTHNIPHRSWLAINGALTLLIGILIWQQWPLSGLWVIGMFVGIDAIITGWTWIMLSIAAKRLS